MTPAGRVYRQDAEKNFMVRDGRNVIILEDSSRERYSIGDEIDYQTSKNGRHENVFFSRKGLYKLAASKRDHQTDHVIPRMPCLGVILKTDNNNFS